MKQDRSSTPSQSAVFLAAAQRLASSKLGIGGAMSAAVNDAVGKKADGQTFYRVYSPAINMLRDWCDGSIGDAIGSCEHVDQQNVRVLLLCFAAAVSDAEDR